MCCLQSMCTNAETTVKCSVNVNAQYVQSTPCAQALSTYLLIQALLTHKREKEWGSESDVVLVVFWWFSGFSGTLAAVFHLCLHTSSKSPGLFDVTEGPSISQVLFLHGFQENPRLPIDQSMGLMCLLILFKARSQRGRFFPVKIRKTRQESSKFEGLYMKNLHVTQEYQSRPWLSSPRTKQIPNTTTTRNPTQRKPRNKTKSNIIESCSDWKKPNSGTNPMNKQTSLKPTASTPSTYAFLSTPSGALRSPSGGRRPSHHWAWDLEGGHPGASPRWDWVAT